MNSIWHNIFMDKLIKNRNIILLLVALVLMTSCALNNGYKNSPGKTDEEKKYNFIMSLYEQERFILSYENIKMFITEYPESDKLQKLRWMKVRIANDQQDYKKLQRVSRDYLEKYPDTDKKDELVKMKDQADERFNTFDTHMEFNYYFGWAMGQSGNFDDNHKDRVTNMGLHYYFKENYAFGVDRTVILYDGDDSQFNSVDTSEKNDQVSITLATPTFTYRNLFHDKFTFMYRVGYSWVQNGLGDRFESSDEVNDSGHAISQKFLFNYCYDKEGKVKCWNGDNVSFGFFTFNFIDGAVGKTELKDSMLWGFLLGIST